METREERFTPSPEWLTAFEKQTPEAMAGVARYADRRAQALTQVGVPTDGEDLVHAVLGDTLEGKLAWSPARVSLRQHVRDAVGSRVRQEARRRGRIQHLPIVGDMDSGDGLDLVEGAASRRVAADEPATPERLAMRASADSAMAALRRLAEGDRDVVAVLDALEAEFYSRGEIIIATGLSARAYDNARRRFAALVTQLPTGVRLGARVLYA